MAGVQEVKLQNSALSLGDEQSEVNVKEPLGVGGIIDFGKRECAFSWEQVIVGQTLLMGRRH